MDCWHNKEKKKGIHIKKKNHTHASADMKAIVLWQETVSLNCSLTYILWKKKYILFCILTLFFFWKFALKELTWKYVVHNILGMGGRQRQFCGCSRVYIVTFCGKSKTKMETEHSYKCLGPCNGVLYSNHMAFASF